MHGNLASSQFDLGHTELFCVPEVTSVFFSSCDSVVGDSLEFSQANRGSICVWLGKRSCSACNAGESGLISWWGGSLMGFLELRQAHGVYTRVTMGMPILNGSLLSEVRTPVQIWQTPREAKLGLVGQYRRYWMWGGNQASLISWHSFIGILINFHKESGIVSFWSNELSAPLYVSKGCEALCPEEVEDYGLI